VAPSDLPVKMHPLSARLPQVAAARASLDSARAQVKKAELDLARTTITAPFDGIVLEANVAQGEFVARGAVLGRIYAASELEIRLPLTTRELAQLNFPVAVTETKSTNVTLSTDTGDANNDRWFANLKRSEGIDSRTQQAHVVATVAELKNEKGNVLQAGQYVNAIILAQELEDVYVVPRGVIREGSQIVLVNAGEERKTLQSAQINVLWTDSKLAAIATDGLPEKPILVTTVLGTVADGTAVNATIDGVAPVRSAGRSGASGASSGRSNSPEGQQNSAASQGGSAQRTETGGGEPQRNGGDVDDEWRKRFRQWRVATESGGEINAEDKALIRTRIKEGKPVPPWLRPLVQ